MNTHITDSMAKIRNDRGRCCFMVNMRFNLLVKRDVALWLLGEGVVVVWMLWSLPPPLLRFREIASQDIQSNDKVTVSLFQRL